MFPEEIEDKFQLYDDIEQICIIGYLKDKAMKVEGIRAIVYPSKSVRETMKDDEIQEKMRPHLVNITDSKNVVVEGVTLRNSPKFHLVPTRIQNLIIENVTVDCPWWAQNGDAMDLSDCHQVLIVNSTVDAGDDGLCMKSGKYKENALVNGCEDILIQDNTVFHAHGGFVTDFITGNISIFFSQCFRNILTGINFIIFLIIQYSYPATTITPDKCAVSPVDARVNNYHTGILSAQIQNGLFSRRQNA